MKNIHFGIVGIGKVTDLHVKALQQIENASIKAFFSRNIQKAKSYAAKYDATGYDDITAMVRNEKIDVIIVCTPHPYHLLPTLLAAQNQVHVLVEKPLASTLEDCDQMITACAENKVKLGVISQRRFYPSVLRMKEAIDQGKIGDPILGTVQIYGWRDHTYYKSDPWRGTWDQEGGGVLVNQAPHQLDLFQWLMGSPITEIFGYWDNFNHPYIEVEDTAAAVLKFANGGLGTITVSNAQKPGIYGKVHVHGKNGSSIGVQTDGGAMFIAGMSGVQEPPYNDIWTIPGEEDLLQVWKREDTALFHNVDPTVYFHRLQIEDFIHAIQNDQKPLVNGNDGRITVEIFSAIYRSRRDKKPITFPVIPENQPDMDGRKKIVM